MDVHERCFYFRPDRPCVHHKASGQECADCPHYRPGRERVLLVKLGAMGDVLRTTALLGPLQRKHPTSEISWLVKPESVPLLENNPYIRSIWRLAPDTACRLQVEEFEICINLDLGPESLALATVAKAMTKLGFGLGTRGEVIRFNPEAEEWYLLSHSDPRKRANRATYQDHMLRILGLDAEGSRIIVNCPEEEQDSAREFLRREVGSGAGRPVVGLNLGAGDRWQRKQWPLEHFRELGDRLARDQNAVVLLLGGEAERGAMADLMRDSGAPFLDTGARNPLPRFAALVGLCDVVVTGDTLALHMALGLGRRVVALFGPTSSHEVEMYGLGTKLSADMDCLACYRERCQMTPSCMESISAAEVYGAVLAELRGLARSREERINVR